MTKQLGIAGAPGGATHYAARLFGLPHEGGLMDYDAYGVCDYLLAVPQERWPAGDQLLRAYPERAYRAVADFEEKLTVIRDPLKVVATNLNVRDLAFIEQLAAIAGVSRADEPTVNFTMRTILAWYAMSLDWTEDAYFRAEAPIEQVARLIPYTRGGNPRPAFIPASSDRHLTPRVMKIITPEVVSAQLTRETRDQLEDFRRAYP